MTYTNTLSQNTVNITEDIAVDFFADVFYSHLKTYFTQPYKDIVFLCIGTDRSTGDSLGPLTGYKMSKNYKRFKNVYVYGTLEEPVHAKNLSDKIKEIQKRHISPFIIAIDACLGKVDRVGYITVAPGPLKPGAGVKKSLPEVGNLHITGIVNLGGFMEYIVLQNTRLNLVMNMAETLADAIYFGLWKFEKENKKEQFLV